MGWGTTNKIKVKKKEKRRTAIHHNTTHPWFIIQAQVSVIQHAVEPPGSCQARVKLGLKILSFGITIKDNTMIKDIKLKLAHVLMSFRLHIYIYMHVWCFLNFPEAVNTPHLVRTKCQELFPNCLTQTWFLFRPLTYVKMDNMTAP